MLRGPGGWWDRVRACPPNRACSEQRRLSVVGGGAYEWWCPEHCCPEGGDVRVRLGGRVGGARHGRPGGDVALRPGPQGLRGDGAERALEGLVHGRRRRAQRR